MCYRPTEDLDDPPNKYEIVFILLILVLLVVGIVIFFKWFLKWIMSL